MNKARREALEALSNDIEALKEITQNLAERLGELRDEEQEYFDNMPESLQQGDRGQNAEAAASALDSAVSELEGFDDIIDGIIGSINEATNT